MGQCVIVAPGVREGSVLPAPCRVGFLQTKSSLVLDKVGGRGPGETKSRDDSYSHFCHYRKLKYKMNTIFFLASEILVIYNITHQLFGLSF